MPRGTTWHRDRPEPGRDPDCCFHCVTHPANALWARREHREAPASTAGSWSSVASAAVAEPGPGPKRLRSTSGELHAVVPVKDTRRVPLLAVSSWDG